MPYQLKPMNRTGDPDRAAAQSWPWSWVGCHWPWSRPPGYMQATGTPLARYLPLFRARQADLLTRGQAGGHPEHMAASAAQFSEQPSCKRHREEPLTWLLAADAGSFGTY
jgi:hypothetical protein